MTILLILILLILSFIYSVDLTSNGISTKPLIVLYLCIIFLSLIGRYILIQDCTISDKTNISKIKNEDLLFSMTLKKYGGIQFSCVLV